MADIPKTYDPAQIEQLWYQRWLAKGCFTGTLDRAKEPYAIMIPPPNVTGVLTMGHVLNNTLQDVLIRHARQQGKAALWLPGTDHAGIATQTKVEAALRKVGKSRTALGRDKFIAEAKRWRDDHGGKIISQLQRLGASCDWGRIVHTLDPDYSQAVLTAFVRLFKKGNIYRGKRMVNYCPVSRTALSDEEVVMKPQSRILYKVRYELVDTPGHCLEVATTRPETIMGDTAVAVHPDDERYQQLIGKYVWRPFPRAQLPIIADAAVELGFGTGALKVTPAHDKADFAIGQRHNLPAIDLFNDDGTLNELAGTEFIGLDRTQARKLAVAKLKAANLLISEEPYTSHVGFSERAGVPIEPRISEQWFLRYPRVEEAKQVVREGLIKFYPARWAKTYLYWLENIQDWCISRQLWWGHRIPVWYQKGADRRDSKHWHVSLAGPPDPENWEQDQDTLDTWASSWLWAFATLGWPPDNTKSKDELNFWYPTQVLVTGPDIIFFWVARMIMAGLEFMGDETKDKLDAAELARRIPFQAVYFTGIIRDQQGRKMSKSLGNSPDPVALMDKYGADGLRLGTLCIAPQGQDILFSEERVQQGRYFCNKLWNACRFRQLSGELADNRSIAAIVSRLDVTRLDMIDHAMLRRLVLFLDKVDQAFARYELNGATQEIYTFFWGDFCDWYVEVCKVKQQDSENRPSCLALQDLCLRQILLVLHPFVPFITEQLWHDLGYATANDTFIQEVPLSTGKALVATLAAQEIVLNQMAFAPIAHLRELISQGRALKAQCKLQNNNEVTLRLACSEEHWQLVEQHQAIFLRLVGAVSLTRTGSLEGIPATVTPLGTLYLEVTSVANPAAKHQHLTRELQRLEKAITAGESKLKNKAFLAKAPPNIVAGAKKQLATTRAKKEEVERLLATMT